MISIRFDIFVSRFRRVFRGVIERKAVCMNIKWSIESFIGIFRFHCYIVYIICGCVLFF